MSGETEERQNFMRRMKSSQNVKGLLEGDVRQCSHYIDELDRFSRNFASHDKVEREQERRKKIEVLEHRRRLTLEREKERNQQEDRYARKYFDDIEKSQKLYEARLKKTAHTNSLPINPITNQYDKSPSGSQLKLHDNQHKVKQLVRAHNLFTRGTSGYNLINGSSLPQISNLVPQNMQNRFNQKLIQHYQHYRLKANSALDKPTE